MVSFLVVAAVLPGLFFLRFVYRLDKIEKEPKDLIIKLLVAGALTTIPAIVLEEFGSGILSIVFDEESILYAAFMYYVVVACSEEGVKYFALKRISWKHPAFDYRFDAIVYSVSVSLGFAILENIEYVLMYGLHVAILRAITAIPAHTIFAIFMGHYYGEAKLRTDAGESGKSKYCLKKAYIIPVLLHGTYDFFASNNMGLFGILFFVFVVILDVVTYLDVKKYAKEDRMI